MVLTVMKLCFPKGKLRIFTHRKYKNIRNDTLLTFSKYEADKQIAFLYENGLDAFSKICTDVLEKYLPGKKDIFEQINNLSLTLKSRMQS